MNIRSGLFFSAIIFALPLALLAPPARAWVAPTTGTTAPGPILYSFAPPPHNWLPGHRGVDLLAVPESPIVAAASGIVAFAGTVAGSPTVSLDHEEGVRTTYQPVIPSVRPGERVTEGQVIGILAEFPAPHHEPGTGLHWGARPLPHRDRYLNPLGLLPAPAIRLKPVDAPARRPAATG